MPRLLRLVRWTQPRSGCFGDLARVSYPRTYCVNGECDSFLFFARMLRRVEFNLIKSAAFSQRVLMHS